MANPLLTIKLSGIVKKEKRPKNEDAVKELVSKAFATRNLLHFAHWNTRSFAAHSALGELYDSIIEDIDEIVETYQGKNGIVDGFKTESATVPDDICYHVKDEAKWVESNRSKISGGDTAIENLIDTLIGHYHKTVYKLENLR